VVVSASETFGSLLRRYRLGAGLSQEALAERAGLSTDAIAHLERGRRNAPRLVTVGMLADALQLGPPERAALIGAATKGQAAPVARAAQPEPLPASVSSLLPAAPTPLIGRERDVAQVTHFIRRAEGLPVVRLLTLSGPGGIGKTRLALAVAADVLDLFPDGVVFVDLSALREPSLVVAAVARAVGVGELGSERAADRLSAHLHSKHLLLVLDNFEQVVESAPLVAGLLAQCSRLVVLATSRAALRVRGEQLYEVPPLAVPRTPSRPPLEAVANYPAIRLFVARAQAVKPEFQLDETHLDAVIQICRRLDGLPLAIELAAARSRLLSPAALLARLEQRLPLLIGGARDLPARQQTLRAAIDWSYDLLDPREQRLFVCLGIFAGPCSLDAVEAVCDLEGPLDLLTSLIDHSLVSRTEHGGEARLTMLETLREYARTRSREQGIIESLSRRHAEYYLAFAEAVQPDFGGPGQRAWLERLDREIDDLRAALRWASDTGAKELGLRIAGVLWRLWFVYGRLSEGRAWLEQLLRQPGEVPLPVLANAVRGAAGLALQQLDFAPAAQWCDESLDIFRRLGDSQGIADALNSRANIARDQGDYPAATALYEESLGLYRSLSDTQGIAAVLNNLGITARYAGDLERAVALSSESLALRRQMGDSRGMAWALNNLGGMARLQSQSDQAQTLFAEALMIGHAVGDRLQTVRSLEGLAALAGAAGKVQPAARLFAAASHLRSSVGATLLGVDRAAYDDDLNQVRTALAADGFAAAWADGLAMGIEEAVALAQDLTLS